MNDLYEQPFEPFEKPSKSARKREMTQLQNLGEALTHLTLKQLKKLELPAELVTAIKLTHGMPPKDARRRQVQFIGRLMRELDVETQDKIRAFFADRGK